jgi:hypothetical protein
MSGGSCGGLAFSYSDLLVDETSSFYVGFGRLRRSSWLLCDNADRLASVELLAREEDRKMQLHWKTAIFVLVGISLAHAQEKPVVGLIPKAQKPIATGSCVPASHRGMGCSMPGGLRQKRTVGAKTNAEKGSQVSRCGGM